MGKRQGKQSNAKLVFENIENARSGEEGCVSPRSTVSLFFSFSFPSHRVFEDRLEKSLPFSRKLSRVGGELWEERGLDLAGARAPRECSR